MYNIYELHWYIKIRTKIIQQKNYIYIEKATAPNGCHSLDPIMAFKGQILYISK